MGNTCSLLTSVYPSKDHPHLCGEHAFKFSQMKASSGSPPPVWGTLNFSLSNKLYKRITPTCVGNTKPLTCVACPFEDHPHLCGEHTSFFRQRTIHKGSPPPVWGTLRLPQSFSDRLGITPTCVGNTLLGWI